MQGGDWQEHRQETAAALAAQLHERAEQRGLVLDSFGDLVVETGEMGTWARMTRTATGRPRT